MDEIEVLTRQRPAHPPLSDAERATAKEQLMTHIDQTTRKPDEEVAAVAEVDLTARPRRNRRTLRRIGLVGAAAAVAAVALAVGTTDRGPAPLRDRPATAAEQLAAIADIVAPYPDAPYSVRVRSVDRWVGPDGRTTGTNEALVHHAAPGVSVSETDCETPCLQLIFPGSQPPPFATDADPAAIRTGIEDVLRDRSAPDDTAEHTTQARLNYLSGLLQHPAASPTARAEILRLVAEIPGLTATPGERSATGAEGTLFRVDSSDGSSTTFLIDPSDGYVLEQEDAAPGGGVGWRAVDAQGSDVDGVMTFSGPEGDHRSTTTYDRPVAGDLPDDVAALAEVVAEKAPAGIVGDATEPAGVQQCIGDVGPTVAGQDGEALGISVPDGLAFSYCGLP